MYTQERYEIRNKWALMILGHLCPFDLAIQPRTLLVKLGVLKEKRSFEDFSMSFNVKLRLLKRGYCLRALF